MKTSLNLFAKYFFIFAPLTLAVTAGQAQVASVISDLASPRTAIDFGNPSYGYAQEFTITNGTWNIFQLQINLGDLATMPGSPLLQVRNSLGASLGPGTDILGSFTLNPNDIPIGFNFTNVIASATTAFTLGPGTYWLCLGNNQSTGGFWVPFASDSLLAQSGVAGSVNQTAVAQSSDGGLTFGAPSLGGYALLFELDSQPAPVLSETPVIASFNPALGTVGASVAIIGNNFSPVASNNIVYFGGVQAAVSAASSSSLTVTVPAGAIYAPISVTVGGLTAYSMALFLPTFFGAAVFANSSLAPRFDLDADNSPDTVVTGDLDGDGKLDMVVHSGGSPAIAIFRNISSGGPLTTNSFAPPVILQIGGAGGSPGNVVLADLDGDGRLDIVTCSLNDAKVSIFQNFCTPGIITADSFGARVDLPVSDGPAGVVVGDMDGDGLPDVVTANWGGTVSVIKNLGAAGNITAGSFAAPVNFPVVIHARNVAIADLDGDGKPDIASIDYNDNSGNISILQNVGTLGVISNNSFASAIILPSLSTGIDIKAADLDGDGKLDLVATAGAYGQAVSVYRNVSVPGTLSTDSFAPRVDFPFGAWAHNVAIGDLDGDGKPDLAVAGELPSQLSVFRNISTPGNIALAPRIDFSTGYNPWGVTIGDLDGDGRPDISFGNNYETTVSIYQNLIPFAPASSCVSPPDGLAAWWPAEGNADDIIGGNDGVLMNGAGFGAGEVGNAFSFDNSGTQAVDVPWSPGLDLTNQITIEFWMKANPTNSMNSLQGLVASDNYFISIDVGNPNTGVLGVDFGINDNGTFYQVANANSGGARISAGVWHHIAGAYDGTKLQLYVDGQPWGNPMWHTGHISPMPLSGFLSIGSEDGRVTCGCTSRHFWGLIDEAAIYNRALSSNEIAAIYNAGASGKCPPSLQPPFIIAQPTNQTVNVGGTATFSVTDGGTQPLFYQWRVNGTNIPGATNVLLALTNVHTSDAGNYSVQVTNILGAITSSNAVLSVDTPPVADATATKRFAISANGSNAPVVLNGSRSYDADGDTLQYSWFVTGSTNVLTNGVVAVVALPVGTNFITLMVSDGFATDGQTIDVDVLTFSQAVERLIAVVEAHPSAPHSLDVTLRAALASINRGDLVSAFNDLRAFERQVKSQLALIDPDLAQVLFNHAQAILNAIIGSGGRTPNLSVQTENSNGHVHLNFTGELGGTYVIEASTNLVNWQKIGVASDQGDGSFTFEDDGAAKSPMRYYRIAIP